MYPEEDMDAQCLADFREVKDVDAVLQVPTKIPLEVAAMIPKGGHSAYSALLKAKFHVEKLQEVKSCVKVLLIGAGDIGLCAVRLAKYLIGTNSSKIRLFVADNSIDKLLTAKEHGCFDIIHWNEEDHEQFIIECTMDVCQGGIDVIVDFVSSPRTVMRSLKILNREGLILVGGHALSEVKINLNTLAARQQSIVEIPKGTPAQIRELVNLLADGKVVPPEHTVFPAMETHKVFDDLAQDKLTERAILSFGQFSTQHVNKN